MYRYFLSDLVITCTIAVWSRTPLSPTAIEVADITRGPPINLMAIPIAAILVPQAIIRGWSAMNNPIKVPYDTYWI